jgi:hypothetical protein
MSLLKNAIALSSVNSGLRALITNIINQSNDSNIASGAGAHTKKAFYNHGYDKDPATNGGKLGSGVSVDIYYQPSSAKEYDSYDVVDKATGLLSGRRRLAVRVENETYSFYTTNHPQEDARLRTNAYGVFTPVNPAK